MITTKIEVKNHLAEYIIGKYWDESIQAVHFPPSSDIYVTLYDLLDKRPKNNPRDTGNLTLALPDRRDANKKNGKDPKTYNYLSKRSSKILEKRITVLLWAELHEYMDEQKHLKGVQYKESVYIFLKKYCIESISSDALLKNYQRWKYDMRRSQKRSYSR